LVAPKSRENKCGKNSKNEKKIFFFDCFVREDGNERLFPNVGKQ
jgi:hypothetical protein